MSEIPIECPCGSVHFVSWLIGPGEYSGPIARGKYIASLHETSAYPALCWKCNRPVGEIARKPVASAERAEAERAEVREREAKAARQDMAAWLREHAAKLDEIIEWAGECMGYAMPEWGWKYGNNWIDQQAAAHQTKAELIAKIEELEVKA